MSKVIEFKTSYKGVNEQPIKSIKFPIVLKNQQSNKTLLYINFVDGIYKSYVLDKEICRYEDDFTICLERTIGYLYQEMIDAKKVNEKHYRLVDALKESLSTPFNKL